MTLSQVKVCPQPFPCSCWLMEGIQRATASRQHPGSCSTLQAPTHLLALVPIEATGTFHAPVTLQGWGSQSHTKPALVLARRALAAREANPP